MKVYFEKWSLAIRPNGIYFADADAKNASSPLEYFQNLYNYTKVQFGENIKIFTAYNSALYKKYIQTDTGNFTDVATAFDGKSSDFVKAKFDSINNKNAELIAFVQSSDTTEDMKNIIKSAAEKKFRYIYVTNGDKSYTSLPKYLEDEVKYISSKKNKISNRN